MAESGWDQGITQVRQLRDRGYTEEQIRQVALSRGWTAEQVDKLFAQEAPSASAPPQRATAGVPRPVPAPSAGAPVVDGDARAPGHRGRVSIGEALADSLRVLSGATVPLLVGGVLWWGLRALLAFAAGNARGLPGASVGIDSMAGQWIALVVLMVARVVTLSVLAAGLCSLCLKALRGQRTALGWREATSWILPGFLVGIAFGTVSLFARIVATYAALGAHVLGGARLGLLGAWVLPELAYTLLVGPLFAMAFPAVVDGRGAGEAMVLSVREGLSNWGALAGLSFILVAVNLLARYTGGYGVIVTVPWTAAVVSAAYEQVVGRAPNRTA